MQDGKHTKGVELIPKHQTYQNVCFHYAYNVSIASDF